MFGGANGWLVLWVVALVGGFFMWRSSKNKERARVATARLEKDTRLYQHIKTGMREYNWREDKLDFWKAQDRQLLFETAHLAAYYVEHSAEARVGFYFKDLSEYGLYGAFAGNDGDHYESYYRTDRTFQKEEALLYDDDD